MGRKILWFTLRRGLLVLAAAACWILSLRFGFWITLGTWLAASGIVCAATAILLKSAKPGEMGWKNYLAGFVLQFGYAIGRGKLAAITIVSWVVWVLIGLAAALAASPGAQSGAATPAPPPTPAAGASTLAPALLLLAWAVDGGILLYVLGVIVKNFKPGSREARRLGTIIGLLIVLIAASVFIWQQGYTYTAALVAGGPALVVGLFYGLFVLLIVTAGRNARWN